MDILKRLKACRRVSVPIVVYTTPDQNGSVSMICDGINGGSPKLQWDFCQGVKPINEEGSAALAAANIDPEDTVANPAGMIQSALQLPPKTILFVKNAQRFIDDVGFIQAVCNCRDAFKADKRTLVLMGVGITLPPELSTDVFTIDEELPDEEQLRQVIADAYRAIDREADEETLQRGAGALKGISLFQAEQITYTSLTPDGLDFDEVWNQKKSAVEQGPGMELYRGIDAFDQLGGLQALKDFCVRSINNRRNNNPLFRPKGVFLLGVPGTGKSAFAKALGNETGRPTLLLDVGALMGSLVGQSEENTRQALKVVYAMSPCILFCDEIEKAFSGVGDSGDSGVSTRLFGTFLTWLNDHTSDVFVVCTCNDISKLPPEFSRAERFDGIFFLDLPGESERAQIWDIFERLYEVEKQERPNDEGWTGAEIRACCRMSAILGVSLVDAGVYIVPVSSTSKEKVDSLKNWARNRCLDANQPGMFQNTIASQPLAVRTRNVG